ncbi:DUF4912 domain-containing protein [Altericista sp. CCNU0014]|uniref:DUF4912 domain-containing protein n=1 Tax=Altericista sp. CCNU0014 TaxID=3082949 RepID=UPI00384B3038
MTYDQPPLEEMTLRQLRRVASRFGVSRYSRMRKDQLLAAIQDIQNQNIQAPMVPHSSDPLEMQEQVESTKFDVGVSALYDPSLASVDESLGDLPEGYGESRIVLMPRDPQWAYAYWDIPNEHKSELRSQGGQQLAVRIYDVSDIDIQYQVPHSVQEYPCDEMAREWYLPIPVSDRDYVVEIGYRTFDGRWLLMARSAAVRIPPTYPSDWIDDHFVTVDWESDLRGQTIAELKQPSRTVVTYPNAGDGIYDQIFNMAQGAEALRVDGSVFGSMQQAKVHEQSISSYVFPSGVGLWALPTASGAGLTASGAGLFSGSLPARPRKFWLVADAELIVYGATEPDAHVTIGGRPIELTPDGTFRYQMSFQDGLIDFPIMAVASDGEQTRAIHMRFTRETPDRRTNTKAEALEEWFV